MIYTSRDFARMLGWGTRAPAIRRARRYLIRLQVGIKTSKRAPIQWTESGLRMRAHEIWSQLDDMGVFGHDEDA